MFVDEHIVGENVSIRHHRLVIKKHKWRSMRQGFKRTIGVKRLWVRSKAKLTQNIQSSSDHPQYHIPSHLDVEIDSIRPIAHHDTNMNLLNFRWVPKRRLQSLDTFSSFKNNSLPWPPAPLKRIHRHSNCYQINMNNMETHIRGHGVMVLCLFWFEAWRSVRHPQKCLSALVTFLLLRESFEVVPFVWSFHHSHLSCSQVHSSKQLQHYTYNTSQMSDVRLSTYWSPQVTTFEFNQESTLSLLNGILGVTMANKVNDCRRLVYSE